MRLLDVVDTPPEVLATLDALVIEFVTPAQWVDRDEILRPRTSMGWNNCGRVSDGVIELNIYVVPGEPIDLYTLGENRFDAALV